MMLLTCIPIMTVWRRRMEEEEEEEEDVRRGRG
jgi:hypothetical protein